MSPSLLQPTPPENHTVWVQVICSPSLEIPMSERAVIMWIWLLWSSTETPIPFFLVSKLRSAPVPSLDVPKASDAHTLKHRLSVLTSLRSDGLITNAEFKAKRQCILGSLWTYSYLLKWTSLYISLKTDERLLAAYDMCFLNNDLNNVQVLTCSHCSWSDWLMIQNENKFDESAFFCFIRLRLTHTSNVESWNVSQKTNTSSWVSESILWLVTESKQIP